MATYAVATGTAWTLSHAWSDILTAPLAWSAVHRRTMMHPSIRRYNREAMTTQVRGQHRHQNIPVRTHVSVDAQECLLYLGTYPEERRCLTHNECPRLAATACTRPSMHPAAERMSFSLILFLFFVLAETSRPDNAYVKEGLRSRPSGRCNATIAKPKGSQAPTEGDCGMASIPKVSTEASISRRPSQGQLVSGRFMAKQPRRL
ncbi:hypothetical protein CONLIGDRAFT_13961 [Coniochaeta ligniaria NRRL 30616]|uniref:Uncharacterized protein n=1 Tax=Coniochaeta ligniaria NRRL 30616 TaxID=1408157 RepID=A0A1J7K372_9PEZI|nr:hypothetical protein CONLIGDRAFT_13961 [Coniochaeta ligniaria NRRL 30616]